MMSNIEIAEASDRLRDQLGRTREATLDVPPPAVDAPARVDETGVELKRGAFLNTIAMLASNFRGIFTFLVARMLGPAALGIFSVAWSTTDILSKIGVLGLDNAIITFIARSEAVGDHARSRVLFRVAVVLGVAQSAVVAGLAIAAIRLFHHRLHLQPEMVSALAVVLCAMPGLALYRISTSVSRGMKVMRHDIFSRGMTEPIATTLAFLVVFIIGLKTFAPELAAIIGTANGLRKVNQAFNPIFAPVVAGMTATGDHETAAATYARLAQWMLWILLPLVAVMSLAGGTILLIYGPAFRQGGVWLGIVALASAINAFVALGETVIMVQRPRLNLLHSSITCAVAAGGLLWLIPRFGAMGAAFGILLPYIVQGILRYATLRWVFHWKDSWSDIRPPLIAAGIALVPALVCRAFLSGIIGQVTSAAAFLAVFGVQWLRHHTHRRDEPT